MTFVACDSRLTKNHRSVKSRVGTITNPNKSAKSCQKKQRRKTPRDATKHGGAQDVEALEGRDYASMENPSLLRFLVDMKGEDTNTVQLRDDLITMLIAGHETTASALTWALFELVQQPELLATVRAEIDVSQSLPVPPLEGSPQAESGIH